MMLDAYYAECRAIHANLTAIAEEMRNMAFAKCATPDNPRFEVLLKKQTDHLARLAELDEEAAPLIS